jgi:hypothetical protein
MNKKLLHFFFVLLRDEFATFQIEGTVLNQQLLVQFFSTKC